MRIFKRKKSKVISFKLLEGSKKVYAVRVSEDTYRKLRLIANVNNMTMSDLMRKICIDLAAMFDYEFMRKEKDKPFTVWSEVSISDVAKGLNEKWIKVWLRMKGYDRSGDWMFMKKFWWDSIQEYIRELKKGKSDEELDWLLSRLVNAYFGAWELEE